MLAAPTTQLCLADDLILARRAVCENSLEPFWHTNFSHSWGIAAGRQNGLIAQIFRKTWGNALSQRGDQGLESQPGIPSYNPHGESMV